MRTVLYLSVLAAVAAWMTPKPAQACGGFFCGQQPVDQQAERIIFAVGENEAGEPQTTMITQISYKGTAENFAWVLPLAEVPDVESLDTFPQAALTALDANTGPQFLYPEDCWNDVAFAGAAEDADGGGNSPPSPDPSVTVHIREEVGPYDVAVVESEDPAALIQWLRDNEFRVTDPMEPYIALYTAEGMKFLALRLQPDADVSDIAPFRLTLPGSTPSVPLRLTALASEPEMGILIFVLGDQRYGPANVPELTIDDADIKWDGSTWPIRTNWTALVARAVDQSIQDMMVPGFVTEMASPTAPLLELLNRPVQPEQQEAQDALLDIMQPHAYLSRMYTRLSAEEMALDPTFRRTEGDDVDRSHMLPRYVDGVDMCGGFGFGGGIEDAISPCEFASCGAGGLCREAMDGSGTVVAGCACAPGATARTTFAPDGSTIVACQDQRMSFLNPGDRELPDAIPLPDPCVGFDCGPSGTCVAMNMTPTCECDREFVAIGSLGTNGVRQTDCVAPLEPVPADFYRVRLPDLNGMTPGRDVVVPATEEPLPTPFDGGDHSSGCSVGGGDDATSPAGLLALIGVALAFNLRRKRRR